MKRDTYTGSSLESIVLILVLLQNSLETVKSIEILNCFKIITDIPVYNSVFGTRCLRLLHNNDPFMSFDELPSGRLRAVKHRVILRQHSFRSRYVTFINSKIFNFYTCFSAIFYSFSYSKHHISHL